MRVRAVSKVCHRVSHWETGLDQPGGACQVHDLALFTAIPRPFESSSTTFSTTLASMKSLREQLLNLEWQFDVAFSDIKKSQVLNQFGPIQRFLNPAESGGPLSLTISLTISK